MRERLALTRLNQARSNGARADSTQRRSEKPRAGDPCPECGGTLGVYHTRVDLAGDRRISYLHCRTCGARPRDNKLVIPLQFAPPRQRKDGTPA